MNVGTDGTSLHSPHKLCNEIEEFVTATRFNVLDILNPSEEVKLSVLQTISHSDHRESNSRSYEKRKNSTRGSTPIRELGEVPLQVVEESTSSARGIPAPPEKPQAAARASPSAEGIRSAHI